CAAGPNYARPEVPAPPHYRTPTTVPPDESSSLADLKWFELFKDDKLQDLERVALQQNYDLRNAVARVEAARANVGIVRSNQFPNFAAGANISTTRISRTGQTPLPESLVRSQERTFGSATLSLLSFEVDIWGRLRRATEAARADLLGTD